MRTFLRIFLTFLRLLTVIDHSRGMNRGILVSTASARSTLGHYEGKGVRVFRCWNGEERMNHGNRADIQYPPRCNTQIGYSNRYRTDRTTITFRLSTPEHLNTFYRPPPALPKLPPGIPPPMPGILVSVETFQMPLKFFILRSISTL